MFTYNPLYDFGVLLGAFAVIAIMLCIAFYGTSFIASHSLIVFRETLRNAKQKANREEIKPAAKPVVVESVKSDEQPEVEVKADTSGLREPSPVLRTPFDDKDFEIPTYIRKGITLGATKALEVVANVVDDTEVAFDNSKGFV